MNNITIIKGNNWVFNRSDKQSGIIANELFNCLYETHDKKRENELTDIINKDLSDQLGYNVTVYEDKYIYLDDSEHYGRFFKVLKR